jgi:branched-chain amino acid transport system permease protein
VQVDVVDVGRFDAGALDAIVPVGETRQLEWRHNLDFGASPMLLERGVVWDDCVALAVAAARAIGLSQLGYGFAAIRDDEAAAEASGVPTLRLKLIATALSGGFMGMAGAPLPYYVTYLDPASGFSLSYAVNTIAMPLIGGTSTWAGPVIGAVLLGTLQQVATVTISSALSLLIVGLLLVGFVIAAPNGIVGLVQNALRKTNKAGKK